MSYQATEVVLDYSGWGDGDLLGAVGIKPGSCLVEELGHFGYKHVLKDCNVM